MLEFWRKETHCSPSWKEMMTICLFKSTYKIDTSAKTEHGRKLDCMDSNNLAKICWELDLEVL